MFDIYNVFNANTVLAVEQSIQRDRHQSVAATDVDSGRPALQVRHAIRFLVWKRRIDSRHYGFAPSFRRTVAATSPFAALRGVNRRRRRLSAVQNNNWPPTWIKRPFRIVSGRSHALPYVLLRLVTELSFSRL